MRFSIYRSATDPTVSAFTQSATSDAMKGLPRDFSPWMWKAEISFPMEHFITGVGSVAEVAMAVERDGFCLWVSTPKAQLP
jgi:hypothetical protein